MKQHFLIPSLIILMTALLATGCSQPAATTTSAPAPKSTAAPTSAQAVTPSAKPAASPASTVKPIIWLYSQSDQPTAMVHPHLSKRLPEIVYEATNGRVVYDWRPGLYGPDARLHQLSNSVVEAATLNPPNFAGEIPEWDITHVPGIVQSEAEFYKFLDSGGYDLYVTNVLTKYKLNIVPFYVFSLTPQSLWSKKPLQTVADFKGMRIVGDGRIRKAVEMLGGTGMNVAFPEIGMSLERGLMDGVVTGDLIGAGGQYVRYTPYLNYDWPFATSYFVILAASKKAFTALPEDLQTKVKDAVVQAGKEARNTVRPAEIQKVNGDLSKQGVNIQKAAAGEVDKAIQIWKPLITEWANKNPECMAMLRKFEQVTGRKILQ